MKNSISDLIKEIFAEVNKEIIKILNFKNNEKKLKINEEKTLINNNSNNEKKDNNYIKEDDIINVTNFKEERIDYTEFKNEKTEIINNWKFELDKTIWNYYSELKIPILKGEIIELYNKICETADIELRKKKKSLIKEIIKVKKGNYYFREKIFNDIFSGTIQVINGEYRGNKRNINENYYFRDFFDIIGENINKIIINEINAYLKELPRLNTEIIEYYNLTPNGLPYRYWDKNGKFREEHKFSELEQRILEKTSFRQTKIWNNYEAKKQMILLYLDEWKIIEERVKTEEKLKKKSKKIINAILNLQDYVYFEYNEIEGLYAILKIIENKIRSFIPNYKILETEKELESIKKFFPKSMSNELLENIENFKISKEKIKSILDYEIKNYPKDWKLKLGYIELFNEKKINLIIRFNNDENLEKIIKELLKKEQNSDDKLFYLFLLNKKRELKKSEIKILERIISADRFQDYKKLLEKDDEITPFEASYITGIKDNIDIESFQEIMNIFKGKHDFSSFMKNDRAMRNTVREIYKIECRYEEKERKTYIEICGSSFLKTMIRIMIGSALAVYFKKKDKDYIKMKLENPDKNQHKILSSAQGLYLYKINY